MTRQLPAIAISLFVFAVALPPQTGAQESAPPVKNANVATVWVTMSQAEAYRAFARYLAAQGFTLRATDASLLLIQTEFHDTKRLGSWGRLKLNASVDSAEAGTALHIRGRFSMGHLTSDDGMEVKYGGAGGSVMRKSFDDFAELLHGFPSDSVTFEKH